MKFLLILVACVVSAYAGVGVVTPQIEAEALRLWQQYCGGGRSEGGNDGAATVYCKLAGEIIQQDFQHSLELSPRPDAGQQVVFVQPPSYHYKHDVVVSGGGGSAPKTVIYVKPSKNTHEVNVNDQTSGTSAPQKPSLYFLKGAHGNEQDTKIDSQPQPAPPGTYLPPAGGY